MERCARMVELEGNYTTVNTSYHNLLFTGSWTGNESTDCAPKIYSQITQVPKWRTGITMQMVMENSKNQHEHYRRTKCSKLVDQYDNKRRTFFIELSALVRSVTFSNAEVNAARPQMVCVQVQALRQS